MGIVNKIKWGSSTPIANTFMAGQFPQFDGHLWINSEFGLLDASQGPDTRLMLAVQKKYAPTIAPQAFGQMGFMDAKFATTALLSIKGPVTAKSYNLAARNLKNIHTDILCKPWYVGNALPYHIPNNTDITVDYKDGKVVAEGEVLRHRAGRQGARPDPDLGEEVQPEHGVERNETTRRDDDQGARGLR